MIQPGWLPPPFTKKSTSPMATPIPLAWSPFPSVCMTSTYAASVLDKRGLLDPHPFPDGSRPEINYGFQITSFHYC